MSEIVNALEELILLVNGDIKGATTFSTDQKIVLNMRLTKILKLLEVD